MNDRKGTDSSVTANHEAWLNRPGNGTMVKSVLAGSKMVIRFSESLPVAVAVAVAVAERDV